MKKIMLSLFALMATLSMSAQAIKIYGQNGDLVGVYKNGDTQYKAVMTKDASGSIDGHEFVDLGLPSGTLWAKTNVGADAETEAGLYFAWGETTGYTSDTSDGRIFIFNTLKYCSGDTYLGPYTKYVGTSTYGVVDNKAELEASDDAATVNWGSNWQMPSLTQQVELLNNCTWTWDSTNNGYRVTGANGNSIFLYAAGYRWNNELNSVGTFFSFWSRSLAITASYDAFILKYNSANFSYAFSDYGPRWYGFSVRAVRVQK